MKKILLSILMVLICSTAWPATQLKKTICPSACDYTTLASAVTAQAQDLTATDKWLDLEISGTWSSGDTSAVTLSGYTTDATRYVNIYTTGSASHAGVFSSSKYYLDITNGNAIYVQAGNVTINGLQIKYTHTNAYSAYSVVLTSDSISPFTFKNNIVFLNSSNSYNGGLLAIDVSVFSGGGKSNYVFNNIVYNFKKPGGGIAPFAGISAGTGDYRSATTYIYNNTIDSCDYGVSATQGSTSSTNALYLENNIVTTSTNADITLGTTPTTNVDHNMSTDTSATGTGSLTGKLASDQFVSVGSDYHLLSTSLAKDAGTNLGASYNIDIIGTSRPQGSSWDMGAFEYISGGGGSPWGTRFSNFKGSNFIYKVN